MTIIGGVRGFGAIVGGVRQATGGVGGGSVVVTFYDPVGEIAATDLGAQYQATHPHTVPGFIPFSQTHAWYITTNGAGIDAVPDGMTAVPVPLTGVGPWSVATVAAAAVAAAAATGYTFAQADGVITVSGGDLDPAATVAVSAARVAFIGRGRGVMVGVTTTGIGATNQPSNGTGWIQPTASQIPAGPFRVVGFRLFRGGNVTDGVRMAVGSGGIGDGNPEGIVEGHERTMGNSGANAYHTEWLAPSEIPYYDGGDRLFIGFHGAGASSQIRGNSSVNAGLYADGTDTLWLTDGTTGSGTPFVWPAGVVTAGINYGVDAQLIIQEAPYQEDGGYRVIAGSVEGAHDDDLFPAGTNVDNIFVGWGFAWPNYSGLAAFHGRIRLQTHAAGGSNQNRMELWDATGGTDDMDGDTLLGLIGVTSDTQGIGWSLLGGARIPLTPGGTGRLTLKGSPAPGSESDTVFDFDLGGRGTDDINHQVYGIDGQTMEASELEFGAAETGETAIDFDPQVATGSPLAPDSLTIDRPGNAGMLGVDIGTRAPTVVVGAS